MFLLANTDKITVIVLCIAALVFLLLNIFLVFSLHKHNKKLVKKSRNTLKNGLSDTAEKDNKE